MADKNVAGLQGTEHDAGIAAATRISEIVQRVFDSNALTAEGITALTNIKNSVKQVHTNFGRRIILNLGHDIPNGQTTATLVNAVEEIVDDDAAADGDAGSAVDPGEAAAVGDAAPAVDPASGEAAAVGDAAPAVDPASGEAAAVGDAAPAVDPASGQGAADMDPAELQFQFTVVTAIAMCTGIESYAGFCLNLLNNNMGPLKTLYKTGELWNQKAKKENKKKQYEDIKVWARKVKHALLIALRTNGLLTQLFVLLPSTCEWAVSEPPPPNNAAEMIEIAQIIVRLQATIYKNLVGNWTDKTQRMKLRRDTMEYLKLVVPHYRERHSVVRTLRNAQRRNNQEDNAAPDATEIAYDI